MIAVNIGKTFLKVYNEKYNSAYGAKDFFVEKYFPLFFDEEKYMQWVTNSPFVQGIKKGAPPSAVERKQKLSVLVDKIANSAADASIAIGFPSLDMTATTSGQLTSLELPLKEEDAYLSWIGSGLGIGIQGGLSIFFNKPQLLLDIFDGWMIYRNYLNKTPQLRGNQINTWNGQWIAHRYDSRLYDTQDPTAQFNGISATKDGGLEVNTQSWTSILIGICRTFPDTQLTGYIYNLGQTNTTIGFIPFRLPQIIRPVDLYEKYFGTSKKAEVEQLFGTAFGFTKACQMGSIGINAMEPKGLRDFIEKGKIPVYNEQDEEKKLNFHTYQIWLLAMLNNEQLWESAQQFAASLNQYALSSEKGKKDKTNHVKAVLSSTSQKQFLDNLTIVVEDNGANTNYEEMAKLIHMMPKDNVPYFLTLIRFHFAIISK
ncbi:hypothetical protein [Chitinophaga sp. 212800010-3]|uniref:hypothetical protein n=1 Tax=unclassified Chitinophaga TaxID=2619133 RepID=UPI002DF29500|nr:DUF4225 domain-containing protein [Chitinophaga sp. 212800010-3]